MREVVVRGFDIIFVHTHTHTHTQNDHSGLQSRVGDDNLELE